MNCLQLRLRQLGEACVTADETFQVARAVLDGAAALAQVDTALVTGSGRNRSTLPALRKKRKAVLTGDGS